MFFTTMLLVHHAIPNNRNVAIAAMSRSTSYKRQDFGRTDNYELGR